MHDIQIWNTLIFYAYMCSFHWLKSETDRPTAIHFVFVDIMTNIMTNDKYYDKDKWAFNILVSLSSNTFDYN